MSDPYLLPDGLTLRNKLRIKNPNKLAMQEAGYVQARQFEWLEMAHTAPLDAEFLHSIHHYLFQDVYAWAGQLRTTDLSKAHFEGAGRKTTFTLAENLPGKLAELFQALGAEQHLAQLPQLEFCRRAAHHFVALNRLHPYREGNGRTQRLFWREVAARAGFALDFIGVTSERMVRASIEGEGGQPAMLERMFEELIDPLRSTSLELATGEMDTRGFPDLNGTYVATAKAGRTYRGTFFSYLEGCAGFLVLAEGAIIVGRLQDLSEDQRTALKPKDVVCFIAGGIEKPGEEDGLKPS